MWQWFCFYVFLRSLPVLSLSILPGWRCRCRLCSLLWCLVLPFMVQHHASLSPSCQEDEDKRVQRERVGGASYVIRLRSHAPTPYVLCSALCMYVCVYVWYARYTAARLHRVHAAPCTLRPCLCNIRATEATRLTQRKGKRQNR